MSWEIFSPFQSEAFPRVQAPFAWVRPVSYCFPQRFAEFAAARDAVERMAFAEANWDGYGASPISFQTKVNAKVVLAQLEQCVPAPQVSANSNGTFSFEWETDQGAAHLEIGRTKYSFYVKPLAGAPYFAQGHVNQMDGTIGLRVDEGISPKAVPSFSNIELNP
jgi:hypothetical protein